MDDKLVSLLRAKLDVLRRLALDVQPDSARYLRLRQLGDALDEAAARVGADKGPGTGGMAPGPSGLCT